MSYRGRLIWLLLAAGAGGCVYSPTPGNPGALADRVAARSPRVMSQPVSVSVRSPEGPSSQPTPMAGVQADRSERTSGRVADHPASKAVPPAGDGCVSPAGFAADPTAPLPLPEAIRFAWQNNPRLRSALVAIDRARGQEAVAF